MVGKGGSQPTTNTQRRKTNKNRNNGKFFIPKTKQQFQTCLGRMTIQFFNIAFQFADKAMYLLGPILITLASAIILGLTYVYFRVILPMMAGTNWVYTNGDWNIYWKERGYNAQEDGRQATDEDYGSVPISRISSTFLALSTPMGIFHTIILIFFLVNIIYNYYRCVMTSNSGQRYELVVRELAEVTGFQYPETEEELVQCKRDFERNIYEKMQRKRNEMMAASRASTASIGGAGASRATASLGTTTPGNTRAAGDEESQMSQSSPLMATTSMTNPPTTTAAPTATNNAPVKLPRIHNWQLLSPIEWGYCRYSSRPKPPRSHYDHVTKALVLNMDHYCPWMFNCVGYFNYRYFFNFLWFVTTALWYGTAICFPAFMKLGGKEYRDQVRASGGYQRPLKDIVVRHISSNPFIPTPDERTPVALGFMLCVCLAAAVMCLGGFHLYLVLSAQSTIEFHGNFAKRRNKGGWKNPYSAGSWRKNWEMIYGTRFWSHHDDNTDGSCSNGEDEERFRYRGCWGILLAMMPSNRNPEFLPLPINEMLVRRKHKNATVDVDKKMDLEMGSSEVTTATEPLFPTSSEETEFLMEPKDTNGPLVGRARTKNKL
mmetsp:Transcript_30083/g.63801  ORF Transcript_30083/g.63801 Transcript_30083/m.63801 type:complete len:602 (-) Transcript_30083:1471-3276(-)|eukprot:CAMPEP_0172332070 /NCGR_PEP_ID=MMETSP1058-20130122/62248_1 /TAXON_ID=83371 /ORGANISM="Detonula confervacea, Strain CCMP 353" /LENGTH=601 /DNA_ID=CAMNT_0013049347 /DNA_START=257 /DNA_END=2062 /DNA_ORIENTATION=-